jgi:hypothetical protein
LDFSEAKSNKTTDPFLLCGIDMPRILTLI